MGDEDINCLVLLTIASGLKILFLAHLIEIHDTIQLGRRQSLHWLSWSQDLVVLVDALQGPRHNDDDDGEVVNSTEKSCYFWWFSWWSRSANGLSQTVYKKTDTTPACLCLGYC